MVIKGGKNKGGVLITALFLVVISILLVTGYLNTLSAENKTSKDNEYASLAFYAADAGLQYALEAIRTSPPPNPPGDPGSGYALPHGVSAELFTAGGFSVRFKIERVDSDSTTDSDCPGSGPSPQYNGLSCYVYRSTGTVTKPDGTVVARKVAEGVITIGDATNPANLIRWSELFI